MKLIKMLKLKRRWEDYSIGIYFLVTAIFSLLAIVETHSHELMLYEVSCFLVSAMVIFATFFKLGRIQAVGVVAWSLLLMARSLFVRPELFTKQFPIVEYTAFVHASMAFLLLIVLASHLWNNGRARYGR